MWKFREILKKIPGLMLAYQSSRNLVNKLKIGLKRIIRKLCAKSPLLANIYGFVFGAYKREVHAVLNGSLLYDDVQNPQFKSSPLLRRNIHRLEKGLLMRPRRQVFALNYIEETVDAFCILFEKYKKLKFSFSDELLWARDVLREYFSVIQHNTLTQKLHDQFKVAEMAISPTPKIPFSRGKCDLPPSSFEILSEIAIHRKSVRWFLDKKVPRELVDKAVEIASEAPSACNRQPYEFLMFDKKEDISALSIIPMGTTGYQHNIPFLIIVEGDLSNYYSERDRHLIYVDGSLATMGLILALESMGLSTCCINWPDIEERERWLEEKLRRPAHKRPIMFLAVGYADPEGLVAYSQKKSLNELRSYPFEN